MSSTDNIGSDSAAYQQQLIKLTPPGQAFPTETDSLWVKLLGVFADTMARVDANAVLLINEAFPDTTTQLLPNWERVVGLPDDCSVLGDSYEIRRANLISKLRATGGQSPSYFIDVAAALGYTITITEFKPFRVGIDTVGEGLRGADWWFAFQVNSALNTIIWFRVSLSASGEALAVWGNTRLECVINKLKPAHTVALFSYS